jgi:hypothetical protein
MNHLQKEKRRLWKRLVEADRNIRALELELRQMDAEDREDTPWKIPLFLKGFPTIHA